MIIDGEATINVTGNLGDNLVVGRDSGSGSVIQNGGLFNYHPSQSTFYVCASNNPSTNAFYYMNGGTLNLNGKTMAVGFGTSGNSATGTLTQTGGMIAGVGALQVGVVSGDGAFNLTGGQFVIGSGGIVGSSNYAIHLGGGTIAAAGNWSSAAAMTLTGVNGNACFDTTGGSIVLSGPFTGTGGLTKIGAGTLQLTAPCSYTGEQSSVAGRCGWLPTCCRLGRWRTTVSTIPPTWAPTAAATDTTWSWEAARRPFRPAASLAAGR